MTEHFTLAECESHNLCARHGIPVDENKIPVVKTPTGIISTIAEWTSACEILEVARARIGQSIIVSCGYRGPKLNQLAGGVPTSQHMGCRHVRKNGGVEIVQSVAFDLQLKNLAQLQDLYDIIAALPHDQLIFEKPRIGNPWLHWSWNPYHRNRMQHFVAHP